MINGLQNKQNSDDGINPLKRRSTDAGIDYPRRRATIAVSAFKITFFGSGLHATSVKYVVRASRDVMVQSQNANSALN